MGFLKDEERSLLKKLHRKSKEKRQADRIKCILALDEGYTYAQIENILLLDQASISNYKKIYQEEGIDKLLETNYNGYSGKLAPKQEEELKDYLRKNLMKSAKDIVSFVKQQFKIEYTIPGMVHLLHRLGFVYKKTRLVPSKANMEKQEEFVKKYKELKANKQKDDKIYFIDAVHPQYNSMPEWGWIEKGKDVNTLSNTGRQRININGALDIETKEIIEREDEKINSISVIRLFEKIEAINQKAKNIYVIADNAKYHRSKEVKEYLARSKISLIFLPSYSPNLNLIERVWKLFKDKVIRGKYYERFDKFKSAVHGFFENINIYHEELETLLTERFQVIKIGNT